MTQIDLNPIDTLAAEASGLYAALEDTGRRAMEALRVTDPALVNELIETFEKEEGAAAWLVSRTIGFGGRSALDLLAQGERAQVMHIVHHLHYGLCS
jgi:uncharacterized protein (DUF2384 family)